jgi:hypothetical protein
MRHYPRPKDKKGEKNMKKEKKALPPGVTRHECPAVVGPNSTFTLYRKNGIPVLWVTFCFYDGFYKVRDSDERLFGSFRTKKSAVSLAEGMLSRA